MKIKKIWILFFLITSCATAGTDYVDKAANRMQKGAPDDQAYFSDDMAAQAQKMDEKQTGSLWVNAYSSHLYDNMYRAAHIGDTVTIIVDEESQGLNKGDTKANRKTEHSASVDELGGLMSKLQKIFTSLDPTNLIGAKTESKFQGDGSTKRAGSLQARMTATVTRILKNGNMVIKGEQHMKINKEEQILIVEGIIRPYDIRPDNTILSSSLADARISYTGFGVVAEKQHPGWLTRVLDYVWPF